jgi:hypothetical protein
MIIDFVALDVPPFLVQHILVGIVVKVFLYARI